MHEITTMPSKQNFQKNFIQVNKWYIQFKLGEIDYFNLQWWWKTNNDSGIEFQLKCSNILNNDKSM